MELLIGNKNYSSWSLRAWLALTHFEVAFSERRIPIFTDQWAQAIGELSPSGKVPVLTDGTIRVWDSLAICEYAADRHPDRGWWPAPDEARAIARSASAEMHSGFHALRDALPMNCRLRLEDFPLSDAVRADVDRISDLWRRCRTRFGSAGPWLFGEFSIADAMYAPVAIRFSGYAVRLGPGARAYVDTVLAHPAVGAWMAAGRAETERIEMYEVAAG